MRSNGATPMLATAMMMVAFGSSAPARAAPDQPSVTCTAGFGNVGLLTSQGWVVVNNSDPLGITNWFQGIPARFPAEDGPADSYVSADSDNASGQFPVISDWLITPDIHFAGGSSLSFHTRELAGAADAANHLQVLLCIDGGQSCTDPGDESGDTGGFQTVLTEINPNAVAGGYPADWTQYTVTGAMGVPQSGSGRIAFRYYDLAQASGVGTTIGIDSVTLGAVASCAFTAVVFANGFDGS